MRSASMPRRRAAFKRSSISTPSCDTRERFEAAWAKGTLFDILGVFADQMVNPEANEIMAEFIREKIRSIVEDPETAEALCPKDHPFGTKRPCLDTNYYDTYRKHIRGVSSDAILAAAKDHLHPHELQTLVVGDARVIRDSIAELGIGDLHVHDE